MTKKDKHGRTHSLTESKRFPSTEYREGSWKDLTVSQRVAPSTARVEESHPGLYENRRRGGGHTFASNYIWKRAYWRCTADKHHNECPFKNK